MTGKSIDIKSIRSELVSQVLEKQSEKTADTSRDNTVARGDKMLELVKQQSLNFAPNDFNTFDLDVAPGVVWDDLNEYVKEINQKMTV